VEPESNLHEEVTDVENIIPFFAAFHQFLPWAIAAAVLTILVLGYTGAPLWLWTLATLAGLWGFGAPPWLTIAFLIVATVFNIAPLRCLLVTSWMAKVMKPIMPKISATERTALEAGVVWIEKDLFSGKPDFKKIIQEPYPHLTSDERAFVEGPVERLCESCSDWQIWQERDLPPEAWSILKKEKFFGMIIPKEYGGLGFSALAHSEVIMKLASRSVPLCVTAMVPNSLGPAELLVHYGTDEQKNRLLPRLATGDEIPCFALTEPQAGSDAGAIQSYGILFKGNDGRLKLKLHWKKRWITLAAISTVMGLAFRLRDPENLLGQGEDVGITCALIPSSTPGVVLGQRHDPLGVPFYNCPTEGNDVVVDAEESIIGGVKNAGKGWKMLMESLAAGRGISLPAQSTGNGKFALRATTNHAVIRKQFGMSIGEFRGIHEALARIAGYTYILEAARIFTCGALDQGIKPPVITAMLKYCSTELMRKAVIDSMDVLGGQGISRGPRNAMATTYISAPIGITVEGANILTRTLMVFGQGALRAHPYAYHEVATLEANDLKGFDKAFWGHVGHIVRNLFRATLLSVTRGRLASSPVGGPVAQYYRKLAWASASFAILADIAMGLLGGTLKARQMITGRFADILSWMYLSTAVLRRYEAEKKPEDLPFVHFALKHAMAQMQEGFDGIFKNLGGPFPINFLFKRIVRNWSRMNSLGTEVSDSVRVKIAQLSQQEGAQRDRHTEGIYYPKENSRFIEPLVIQEKAFKAIKAAQNIEKKIRKAIKAKKMPKVKGPKIVEVAIQNGVITAEEAQAMKRAEDLRLEAITVDDFSQEEFLKASFTPVVAEKNRQIG
jgi:acyl-CoA dehydrogenase